MRRHGSIVQPSLSEARRKLGNILKEAEKKGISRQDVSRLTSGRKLLEKCVKKEDKMSSRYGKAAIFVTILAAFFYCTEIHTHQGFSRFWLRWRHGNVKDQPCTVPMPDELVKIFRPPVPCSMCQGITQVDKVSNLTPEIFEDRYAYSGLPVVVTDGMANWTAQHVFTFDFFREVYQKRMDQWRLYNCQFFPYATEFRNLGQVFNMSEGRVHATEGTSPWYVGWSNCDDEINQILRRHYEKPYFLPVTAETKKLDWIFMGTTGFGAPMHVDNVEHPSWQAQLRGRKKWRLQPPPECFYSCQEVEVIVEPGEIIVLDTNRWYHSTLIVSKEMSITIGAEYD